MIVRKAGTPVAVIFDIDRTLADVSALEHMFDDPLHADDPFYTAFHEAAIHAPLDYHGSTDQPLACAGLKAVQQRMWDMEDRVDGGSEVSDLDVVKGMVAMARIAPFVDEEQYDNVQSALREMEHRFDPALVAVANRQAHHSNQRPSKGLGFKDAQGWGAPIWDDESLNDITL